MSSPTTFLMKSGSDGIWVPPAQMILISSVFGSIRLMSCEMKGECFRVKSEKIIAGLQHFSLSKGFAPIGWRGPRERQLRQALSGVVLVLPIESSRGIRACCHRTGLEQRG